MKEESKELTISQISNIPEEIKDDKENYFNELDISKIEYSINEEDFDNDLKELERILDNKIDKNDENENKKISKIEKDLKKKELKIQPKKIFLFNKKLKFKKERLEPLLIDLFLNAYKIISKKYYDIKKEEEDDEDENKKKEKDYIIKLIEQIILEKNADNCKMSIEYSDSKENTYNERFFNIYLYIIHIISKCHGLLNLEIKFKVVLKIAVRSGNIELLISKCSLKYQDNIQKIKMKPNITFLLINNKLGNYSVTYCTCGVCMNCKNRKEIKPFDKLLSYLKKKNKIDKELPFTQLYFGKYNKYRNESGYKCSFCTDFYNKQCNIVKLFCNPDYDSDHTCQFWTCLDCYMTKIKGKNKIEKCPNCEKFLVNFSQLFRIFTYLRMKKIQMLEN